MAPDRSKYLSPDYLIPAILLALAAVLRYWGLSFGLPHDHCRPDEVFMVHKALSIGSGELNPHEFYYPTLHLYIFAVLFAVYYVCGYILGAFSGLQDFAIGFFLDPSSFHLIGRALSALLGAASVWLVYWLGRILDGRRAGCVSALLLAVCFLHVRDSHFATTDVPAAFHLLALCGLVLRYTQTGRARDLYLGAVFLGLAASTKYNAALCATPVLFAGWHGADAMPQKARRLLVASFAMGAAFLAGSPYIALDFPGFWRDINAVRGMV